MEPEAPKQAKGVARWLYLALGFTFVGIGFVGAFVPGLPTTVFLIGAAACFARASTHFYNWLLNNRHFGPVIRAWREERTIPSSAKKKAIILIVVAFATSSLFIANPWGVVAFLAFGFGLVLFVSRIPSQVPRASAIDR